MSDLAAYPKRYCPACDRLVDGFQPGPGGRPNAKCHRCGALERHRFLALVLDTLRPTLGPVRTVLDVAPVASVTKVVERIGPEAYVRVDLGYDGRLVDVTASVTDLPLADASVHLAICFHVLEHVPDDAKAMRELGRVLAPDGLAIIQVPWRPDRPTEEDLEADEEELLRRFGRRDHLRAYGSDFEAKLVEQGLAVTRINARAQFGAQACAWMGLVPKSNLWILRSAGDGSLPADTEPVSTRLTLAFDALVGQVLKERAAADQARERVSRLRDRVDLLRQANAQLREAAVPPRSSLVLRAARRGRRLAKRALGR